MNANEFPIVLFSTETGDIRVNAVLRDRTLWLTQKAMAGLFGVKSQAITKHLKNIYATHELTAASTCSKMEQVQNEGGRDVLREMVFYNLDAIIAVGYNIHVAGSPVIIIGCASLDVGTTLLMREAILSCKCGKGQQIGLCPLGCPNWLPLCPKAERASTARSPSCCNDKSFRKGRTTETRKYGTIQAHEECRGRSGWLADMQ